MHHHHQELNHAHDHHDFDRLREGNKIGLIIALIITAGIMLLEFFGGIMTNSLALLSDSGHMLSDTSSLALSLSAMYFASRPASSQKSFGFYRFEILAALFNGVTLFIIAFFIMKEAYERFLNPAIVSSQSMILIATIGLLANILSAWVLLKKGDVEGNVNLKSAYLHIVGDALGSVGAIIAGVIMLLFGWYIADPIISVLVAILILKSAWGVINHTLHILMEGTPPTIDYGEVKQLLESIEGVNGCHDLHIWTITSGFHCLSCHLTIEDHEESQVILQKAITTIEDKFQIEHATIQIEKSDIKHPVPLI